MGFMLTLLVIWVVACVAICAAGGKSRDRTDVELGADLGLVRCSQCGGWFYGRPTVSRTGVVLELAGCSRHLERVSASRESGGSR
jgi:hypothetical protein